MEEAERQLLLHLCIVARLVLDHVSVAHLSRLAQYNSLLPWCKQHLPQLVTDMDWIML